MTRADALEVCRQFPPHKPALAGLPDELQAVARPLGNPPAPRENDLRHARDLPPLPGSVVDVLVELFPRDGELPTRVEDHDVRVHPGSDGSLGRQPEHPRGGGGKNVDHPLPGDAALHHAFRMYEHEKGLDPWGTVGNGAVVRGAIPVLLAPEVERAVVRTDG